MINYSKCKQKNDEQAPIYVQPVHRLSFKKRSSLLIHLGSQLFDVVGSYVLVIFHHLVDNTIRSQFNHTISNGLINSWSCEEKRYYLCKSLLLLMAE